MTKLAIPVSVGEITEQFEQFQYFLFYEISESKIFRRYIEDGHLTNKTLIPEWLCKKGINILLVKGIYRNVVRTLNQRKIQVYVGCSKNMPDEAVKDFMKGELITNPDFCYDLN